jgi:hypothetical protein
MAMAVVDVAEVVAIEEVIVWIVVVCILSVALFDFMSSESGPRPSPSPLPLCDDNISILSYNL